MVIETWLKTDRKKPIAVKALQGNLFSADNGANLIGVEVLEDGSPATLSGGVFGYVVRADGATVVVNGTLSDNKATVTLPASCYTVVGPISIVIKVGTTTVGACTGYVYRSSTDEIIDPGHVVPSLQELLAQIQNCINATAGANTAAGTANTAAQNADAKATLANTAAQNADAKAGLADTAAQTANTAAGKIEGMTVSATGLEPTASPTATITEVDGHKHIAFGLVKGDPGDATIDDTAGEGDTTKVWSADKSSKLEAKTDSKAPAIYSNVDYTPLASFTDGADDMPVKDLKVAIEPVQDLHGYDHPWPAGGGKNLFGGEYGTKWILPTPLSISAGDSLAISASVPASGNSRINIYTGEDGATRYFNAGLNEIVNGRKVRIATFNEDITITAFLMDNAECTDIQIEKGSTATAYAPYSNICPITGFTGVKVTRTGKNLCGGLTLGQAIVDAVNYPSNTYLGSDSDGNYVTFAAGNVLTGKRVFTNFKPNKQYTFILKTKKENTASTHLNIHIRYSNGTLKVFGADSPAVLQTKAFVTDANKTVVSFEMSYGGSRTYLYYDESGIFEGVLTADDFVPYEGESYDIEFPSEAGTVYGGTLDVTTGVLTVDRVAAKVSDLSIYSGFNVGSYSVCMRFLLAPYATKAIFSARHGAIGTMGVETTAYYGAARINEAGSVNVNFAITTDGKVLTIYDKDLTLTSDAFMAKYGDAVIVYPLATTITYQLTPQQVRTLLGKNAIWADAGDVSLLYPADTKAYIDNQIASTRKLIAGIETEFKASKAYAVGDMLIIGNDLYKVIASIASGATITVGTNVTKTTVAEQLIALANA